MESAGIDGPPVSVEVNAITLDSRKAGPGALFVCMPGMTRDSHSFLSDAAANGAVAALVHSEEGLATAVRLGLAAVLIAQEEFNDRIWRVCDAFFDHPTRDMKVIGVTGTNGKTTTAWLIRDMLRALGLKTAYLGTLGFHLPDEERELSNTTPFAVELYNLLAEARDKGVQALAMEVSSHALDQRRVDGVEFDVAVFTNLTQDHLDYHGSMDAYEAAKWRLFSELPKQTAKRFVGAINVGDPTGAEWASRGEFLRYAVDGEGTRGQSSSAYNGEPLCVSVDQIQLRLRPTEGAGAVGCAPLGGSYNVENLMSAAAGLLGLAENSDLLGVREDRLVKVAVLLSRVRPVPGRFEAVPNDRRLGILVDYAHTPDALEKLLDAVRPLTKGRVITVFGCGGDRDRTKRPKMARAASERSDLTVVTSDNPRTENPEEIVAEVQAGVVEGKASVTIVDRREAIVYAIGQAEAGDVVVIAGKGHENYQIIGRTKYPMDDRELAREGLSALGA